MTSDLVGVHVELAHRAEGHQHVRLVLLGAGQQPADQLVGHIGRYRRHVAGAAVGFEREVDHVRTESTEEVLEHGRVFGVAQAVLVIRAHDHAAVVGRHAQSLERAHHLAADLVQSHVVENDVQGVAHVDRAGFVAQAAFRQGAVDLLGEGVIRAQVVFGFGEVGVAGGAGRREDVRAVGLLGGQGQVAALQGHRAQAVDRGVLGRPAAVPIADLLKLEIRACL